MVAFKNNIETITLKIVITGKSFLQLNNNSWY